MLPVMRPDFSSHPLYKVQVEHLDIDERVALSYQRAKLTMQAYNLSAHDVQYCTPKYWEMLSDPIFSLDIAAFTIIAAHVGLAIGTLTRHLDKRPDFKPLVDEMLRFDTVGIFLLTERGHGLDAFNIETTATKTDTGFILHTPREEAAKFMPASTPAFNIPKVAVVMARLTVDGEDRGCRLFVVPICNHHEMYRGISSTRLPLRSGTSPLDFAITRFNHVQLRPSALVSSDINDFTKPGRPLEAWWDEIWRIKLGTAAVALPCISGLKVAAYVSGTYSMHRCLTGKKARPIPILTFRTQQWPIAHAIAVGLVLSTWCPVSLKQMMDPNTDSQLQHAIAIIVKATVCRHFQRCSREVAERCGAQGLFEHNLMARIENDLKGAVVAEGDILTLCIRLFTGLLLDRHHVSLPSPDDSILARHAHSLLEENVQLLRSFPRGHLSESFNTLILPQSQLAVEAIGHALAYSAAVEANLPQPILDVYQCGVIAQDPAWYSEIAGLSRKDQRILEDKAVTSMLPNLSTYLSDLNISHYAKAPIVSDKAWKEYLAALPVFEGNAVYKHPQNRNPRQWHQDQARL